MRRFFLFFSAMFAAAMIGSSCLALDARTPFNDKAQRTSFKIPVVGEKDAPKIVLYYVIGNLNGYLAICGAYVPMGKALPGYAFDDALRSMSMKVRSILAVKGLEYFPRYGSEAELKRSGFGCKRSERVWKSNYRSAVPQLSLEDWVVTGR